MQIFLAILFSAVFSLAAWQRRALSRSGALAAFFTGALIFGIGGFAWAALLLAFFISSSLWSRVFVGEKKAMNAQYEKGTQRDWGQVLANGGIGIGLVLFHGLYPSSSWPWVAFAGAMAAVNADTWATELGAFSPTQPRLVTNGKPVEKGDSGGVTLTGYAAALGGAALVAFIALLFPSPARQPGLLVAILLAGLIGSTIDSMLGATLQAMYYCPTCRKETERHPVHSCSSPTTPLHGWTWLNNDWVNFISSLGGALACWLLWKLL
jgi:uncharacterized protein (TIGR00297 family)